MAVLSRGASKAPSQVSVFDIPRQSYVTALLPVTRLVERRNLMGRRVLLHRICREYEEMPGMSLTLQQAARLFGLSLGVCERVLDELAASQILCQTKKGLWVRFDRKPY